MLETTDTNTRAIPRPRMIALVSFFSSPQTLSLLTTLVYPGSPLPPRWTNMKPAEKHFRCTVCQRGFTRIDHLKRHHLRRMLPRLLQVPPSNSLLNLARFRPEALLLRLLQRVLCALVRPRSPIAMEQCQAYL
jgi:hypothetical protein